jgi:endonuclease/exonuclease/phosphatase family metal-dependent hydrolase
VILKLLSYNIRYGGAGRIENLAAVIEKTGADLIILQEATQPRVVEQLAKKTGMNHWGSRPGYSLGFISRIEISRHEWYRPRGARHPYLEIVPEGIDARLFGLHLSAIHSNFTERRRERELRAVLDDIEQHSRSFHVLAGDFNTLAPGELLDLRRLPIRLRTLVWLTGRTIRWRTIQIMLDARYVDGYRNTHPDKGGFTFPTWDAHLRLDFIFLPISYADRLKTCEVINGEPWIASASDHFPLLAHLEVGPTVR